MEICRVCMSSSVTLVDIFSDRPLPDYEFSLAEMLNELVDFKVNRNDKLPQKICVTCGLNAQIAFRFQRRFQQSHQLLCMTAMENENNYVCVLSEDSSDESVHEKESESLLTPMIKQLESLQVVTQSNTSTKVRHVRSISSSSASSENEDDNTMELTKIVSNNEMYQNKRCRRSFTPLSSTHGYQLRALGPKSYYQERVCYQERTINTLQKPKVPRSIVRDFRCDQCRSTFATQANLNRHKISHDFIIYNCLQCKAAFGKKTQLENHARTHIGECPHICLHCSKSFRCSSDLNMHLYTHSEMRQFHCKICEMSFKAPRTLQKHLIRHTKVREEHKCNFCNRTYASKWNLKKHMRFHLYS